MRLGQVQRSGRWVLGIAATAVLLFLFFSGIEWTALADRYRGAHRGYLLGVVLASLLTFLVRAWRWGYLLKPVVQVPLGRLVSATFVGFMAALFIPRAAELLRPYLIGRHHCVPFPTAFASIVLERLVDLVTVLFLFSLYLYVLPTPSVQQIGPLIGVLKVGGVIAGLFAMVLGGLLFAFQLQNEPTMRFVRGLLRRLPARPASVATRILRSFGDGLAVLKASPAHLGAIFGQSLLVWFAIALGIHCSYRAFDVELPVHASFLVIAFLTVGVSIPTPGMVGGFHEAYRLALTQVYAVEAEPTAAAAIAAHLLHNLPVLTIGLILTVKEGITLGDVMRIRDSAHSADVVRRSGSGLA